MKILVFLIFTISAYANDTELLNNLLKKSNTVFLENRIYEIDANKVLLKDRNIEIIGHKNKTIIKLIDSVKFNSRKPKSLLTFKNCKRVCIKNINFEGFTNSAYALTFIKDKSLKNEHYEVKDNFAKRIGLVYFRPEQGFSFNFYDTSYKNWTINGKVTVEQLFSNIIISKNECFGNISFKVNSFKGPSVSAISVHFSRNVLIENNNISNYRFGIWIYGGGSRSRDKSILTHNKILCVNIKVNKNIVKQTYSPIWFSKAKNIVARNNLCRYIQDVALDFEGCLNALVIGNKITNSKGGSLVALNGSKNIFFLKNDITSTKGFYNSNFNISLIRDGNSSIHYVKNNFINKTGFQSRIFIKNSSEHIASNNRDIIFKENLFLNVVIEARKHQHFLTNSNYHINE